MMQRYECMKSIVPLIGDSLVGTTVMDAKENKYRFVRITLVHHRRVAPSPRGSGRERALAIRDLRRTSAAVLQRSPTEPIRDTRTATQWCGRGQDFAAIDSSAAPLPATGAPQPAATDSFERGAA
jgi:hypothetical protein